MAINFAMLNNKNMKTEDIMLRTIVLENILKAYKTSLYHEMKISELKKLNRSLEIAPNREIKKEVRALIKSTTRNFDALIKRAEKNNQEATKIFEKQNNKRFDTKNFTDSLHTFMSEFTDLIFKHTNDIPENGSVTFKSALLEESPAGNLFLNNKQYIIHYKK